MYYLLNFLLAPGVIVHELSHAIFCILSGVRIFRMKVFGFGNPPGYVEHAEPETFVQNLLISFGPIIFNSFGALLLFGFLRAPWLRIESGVCLWLGIVLGLEAIPSHGDAEALWGVTKGQMKRSPLVVFGLPFVFLLYILNFLRRWKLGVLYMLFLFVVGFVLLKK
jgi:hypothetical protein